MSKIPNKTILGILREINGQIPAKCHLQATGSLLMKSLSGKKIDIKPNWDFTVILVKRGIVELSVQEKRLKLIPKDILFISPGCNFANLESKAENTDMYVLRFGIFRNNGNQEVEYPHLPFNFHFQVQVLMEFSMLFDKIHRNYHWNVPAVNTPYCSSVLHCLLCDLINNWRILWDIPKVDPRINRVKNYIDDNPLNRDSIAKLSAIAGLTEKYFSALFKTRIGMSPKRYQLQKRMQYAHNLLEVNSTSVKEVAFILDYPDPFIFSKQFKKFFGYPPRRLITGNSNLG